MGGKKNKLAFEIQKINLNMQFKFILIKFITQCLN